LTWDDAFRLESKIGLLLPDDRLRYEIAARLRWAIADRVPNATVLQDAYGALINPPANNPPTPVPPLRDFLLEVMEAIHWHSKRKFITRKVRGQATRRTLSLGLIALLVAIIPYFGLPLLPQPSVRPANLAALREFDVTWAAMLGPDNWAHFAVYSCLTFGFLGALFSRLITLQAQWSAMAFDELFNAKSYGYIVLRASIGVLGALVVYFFLRSGLVSGSVFPDFTKLTMTTLPSTEWPTKLLLPSPNLALLIIWSFVAGFSESLVPTVLSNTERQLGGAVSAKP